MNHPIKDWRGKRVWIIGASSGIGRATAELLLQKGATVAVSARNQAALDEMAQTYPNAVALAVDVTQQDSLQAAYQQFCADEQPLDLYLQSLYLDLKPRGTDVQVVNSGFVATPLTANNDFDMPDLMTAEQAAIQLVSGLESNRFEISFPKRFTSTLKLIKRLPYGLKLRLLSKIESAS